MALKGDRVPQASKRASMGFASARGAAEHSNAVTAAGPGFARRGALLTTPRLNAGGGLRVAEVDDENLEVAWLHSCWDKPGHGQKKKALEALAKPKLWTTVHQVSDVQKLTSGVDRVQVKLEYFRDHWEQSKPLIEPIEAHFMHSDPACGVQMVHVPKLTMLQGRPQSRMSSCLPSLRTPTPRPTTAPESLEAAAMRATMRAARAVTVVQQAKELQMERRIDQCLNLQRRQGRKEAAQRAQNWLEGAACVVVINVMHRIVTAFYQGVKDSDKSMAVGHMGPGRRSGRPGPSRAAQRDVDMSRLLQPQQLETLKRNIRASFLARMHAAVQAQGQQSWTLVFNVVFFRILLRRPMKRRLAMAVVISTLENYSPGYRARMAFRKYKRAAAMVGRAFRWTVQVTRILRRHVLPVCVWVAETELLGALVNIPEEQVRQEVAEYEEEHQVQAWRRQIAYLTLHQPKYFQGHFHLVPEASASTLFNMLSHVHHPSHSQGRAAVGHAFHHHPSTPWTRKAGALARDVDRWSVLELLRLSVDERQEVADQLWRISLDTFWRRYKAFKQAKDANRLAWINWRKQVQLLGTDSRDWWPEPPEVQTYPEELGKVHMRILRKQLEELLRKKQSSMNLDAAAKDLLSALG